MLDAGDRKTMAAHIAVKETENHTGKTIPLAIPKLFLSLSLFSHKRKETTLSNFAGCKDFIIYLLNFFMKNKRENDLLLVIIKLFSYYLYVND